MIFIRTKYVGKMFFLMAILYSCNSKQTNNQSIEKDTLKMFYSNGHIKSYDLINNGLKNGLSCYYLEDGTLEKCMTYKNDTLDGKGLHYFPNGQVKIEVFFKKGKLDGMYRIYDEKGNLFREIQYENGTAKK